MKKLVIKDDKNVKNLFIQVNLKKKSTSVLSNFSAWENLAFILEALGVTAQKCIKDGKKESEVYQAIKDYIVEVLADTPKICEGKLSDFA
ncbi:unnamed protein product [marine sediment metagenome]|uniref:Uncharacterized protein n=1 Tax=marine sediment metagenome TaxID=412755 RepID=X0XB68_9ZZZZ